MHEARVYSGIESVQEILTRTRMVDTLQQQLLSNPETQIRIRSGQRKFIFARARRIGLRDEQLHDLVEGVTDYRTRAIAGLTMAEARRLIGILVKMERAQREGARA